MSSKRSARPADGWADVDSEEEIFAKTAFAHPATRSRCRGDQPHVHDRLRAPDAA